MFYGLLQLGNEFLLSETVAKFINKRSLFLLKFKDAGQAQTKDWLCF